MPDESLDTRCRSLVERLTEPLRRDLEERQNVVGTAVGLRTQNGEVCEEIALIVYVREKIAEQDLPFGKCLPAEVDVDGETIPTDVRPVGSASVDGGSPTREEEIRPILGGTQVGTRDYAGSVSALFRTRSGGERILAARHSVTYDDSALDRDVRQPAGDGSEIIGTVAAASQFSTSGTRRNILDTVLIEPHEDVEVSPLYLGWTHADDTGRAYLGDRVTAFSSGGGVSSGTVVARGVDVTLELGSGETARYGGLIEYSWGGAAGASGAMVGILDPQTRELTIVGQHVGSASSSSWMVPWTHIEREFGSLTPATGDEYQPVTPGDGSGDSQPGQATIVVEDANGDPIQDATVTVQNTNANTVSATIVVEDQDGNPVEGATVTVS